MSGTTAARKTRMGKYQLIATLGKGGMAQVHLALLNGPHEFHKLVVLKTLRDDVMVGNDEALTMFLDEARLAARLHHPNIVQTYEVDEEQGRLFIAMEYLEGQTLRALQRRREQNALPLHLQVYVLEAVARGLQHAHELEDFSGQPLGVVHRDVSPQNIFLTYDGQVKVFDFGIAKAANAEHRTQLGIIKGKVDYIAPEQIHGDTVDRRADLFPIGVMLWEALTGERFAGGPDVSEVPKMHRRLNAEEPRAAEACPDAPSVLIDICDRALAVNPGDRFQSARELADALLDYLRAEDTKSCEDELALIIRDVFAERRTTIARVVKEQVERAAASALDERPLPMLQSGARTLTGLEITGLDVARLQAEGIDVGDQAQALPPPIPDAWPEDEGAAGFPEWTAGDLQDQTPTGLRGLLAHRDGRLPALAPITAIACLAVFLALQVSNGAANARAGRPPAEQRTPDGQASDLRQRVTLRVRTQPSEAVVTLDGVPLDGNELSLSAVSLRPRVLTAHAPGYLEHIETVVLERDLDLRLTLRPEGPSSPEALEAARLELQAQGARKRKPNAAARQKALDRALIRRASNLITEDPYL